MPKPKQNKTKLNKTERQLWLRFKLFSFSVFCSSYSALSSYQIFVCLFCTSFSLSNCYCCCGRRRCRCHCMRLHIGIVWISMYVFCYCVYASHTVEQRAKVPFVYAAPLPHRAVHPSHILYLRLTLLSQLPKLAHFCYLVVRVLFVRFGFDKFFFFLVSFLRCYCCSFSFNICL